MYFQEEQQFVAFCYWDHFTLSKITENPQKVFVCWLYVYIHIHIFVYMYMYNKYTYLEIKIENNFKCAFID